MEQKNLQATVKKVWETPALVDISKETILGAGIKNGDGGDLKRS